jgi:3-oxoacyl-[acyl-carrier protein] reductase
MVRRNPPASVQMLEAATPLKRLGSPHEIAAAMAFLLSDDAAYITGEVLAVNGGIRMD